MKKLLAIGLLGLSAISCNAQSNQSETANNSAEVSTVYYISDITPENLQKIYHALGKNATGRVGVKISTGESMKSHQLAPGLIAPLVKEVNGTLVECNTAYPGTRNTTEAHLRTIEEHGYNKIAKVDIMDAEGSMPIDMRDTTWFKQNLVGTHLANYDFLINLAHFKGHAMGGFGGVLKNQSIGVASSKGKLRIHTAGATDDKWQEPNGGQDGFLESMAAAAQSVHDYFKGNILYINVMNNLSVDCDCDANAHEPLMKDMGILASTDPVALDKACLDLVFSHTPTAGDDSDPLIERITSRHGTHTVDHAEKIGLGTTRYRLIDITDAATPSEGIEIFNVFTADGKKAANRARTLDILKPGSYIVNGSELTIPAK